MGATFLDLNCHIIFATRYRQPWIKEEWQPRLHAYIGGVLRNHGAKPIAVGGAEDHVHLLVGLRGTHAISDLVRETKKSTSVWVKDEIHLPPFAWQDGYAAFSVGAESRENVIHYIANQQEHHRRHSALDELEALLKAAGVEYDPKYLE